MSTRAGSATEDGNLEKTNAKRDQPRKSKGSDQHHEEAARRRSIVDDAADRPELGGGLGLAQRNARA